jgi:hypothetical protein
MKKLNLFTFLVLLGLTTIFSCQKSEKEEILSQGQNEKNLTQMNYIVDGTTYPETIRMNSDNTADVISSVSDVVVKVIDNLTAAIVADPFNKNTYYVFKSAEESKTVCKEIENKIKSIKPKNPDKQTGAPGVLELYTDRNFVGLIYGNVVNGHYYLAPWIDYDITWRTGNYPNYRYGIQDMGIYNDVVSSYRVYGDSNDAVYYRVFFYENSYFGGHFLTAYANVYGQALGYLWSDSNLHGTLMQGGLHRKYWGDQISSISWEQY